MVMSQHIWKCLEHIMSLAYMHAVKGISAGISTPALETRQLHQLAFIPTGGNPRRSVWIAHRLLPLFLITWYRTPKTGWTVILKHAVNAITIGHSAIASVSVVAALLQLQLATGMLTGWWRRWDTLYMSFVVIRKEAHFLSLFIFPTTWTVREGLQWFVRCQLWWVCKMVGWDI